MAVMSRAAAVNGKVIAITGGARGIGLATAKTLHGLGAKVAIGDVDEAAVKESGADLDLGFYARLDVTDRQSFTTFLDEVECELGSIDVLVNNAGICPTGGSPRRARRSDRAHRSDQHHWRHSRHQTFGRTNG
jgi:NAD(P)-dependent dehydrogenase (short-subunit alcohol dehydrogenase family)